MHVATTSPTPGQCHCKPTTESGKSSALYLLRRHEAAAAQGHGVGTTASGMRGGGLEDKKEAVAWGMPHTGGGGLWQAARASCSGEGWDVEGLKRKAGAA
jgi:hypothetical protein